MVIEDFRVVPYPDVTPGPGLTAPALRRARQRAGLTQQELAGRAGLSVRALRDIERGRVALPRAASRRRLAAALGLPDLAGIVEQPIATGQPPSWLVGVLGPVTVAVDQAVRCVGSPLRRALLGLLALRHGTPVPVDEIVDVIWDEPPRTCRGLVHGHVAALRRLLRGSDGHADAVAIHRVGGGYLLEAPTHAVDVAQFETLLAQATRAQAANAPHDALLRYQAALALWRGRAVADAGSHLHRHPDAVAVTKRRIAVAIRFADLALTMGRHTEAVAAVEPLLAEEPHHEGLAARLVTGLAGVGDRYGALTTYDTVRRRLAEDLGVSPGPELRAAHLAAL